MAMGMNRASQMDSAWIRRTHNLYMQSERRHTDNPRPKSYVSRRLQVRVPNAPRPRRRLSHGPARAAPPLLLAGLELVHGGLDLRAEVRAVKGRLVHDGPAAVAVPAHAVEAPRRPALLEHDADRVGEADGVVRRVGGQQEHVALADDDVLEGAVGRVDDLEGHGALVLVEPLGRRVDVVVGAGVGAADDLAAVLEERALTRMYG
ncbi:hypothetical protein VDGD_21221 [Verticillium dahliae]|nr:hypothetical protein VDGD_21221 [Verticillium dahliae]